MSEWQPIETAPKDASKILVLRDGEYAVAAWVNAWSGEADEHADWHWFSPRSYHGSATCDRMVARNLLGAPEWGEPTHWMPLPDPPQ